LVHDQWVPGSIFETLDLRCGLVEDGGFEKHKSGQGAVYESL
jgi:hypothetical protein